MIPLQNGIDAAERLIPILGREAVMGGVAQISASIIKPGVIRQVATFIRMIFGELDGKCSKRGEEFLDLCLKAGFDATLSDQILTELWMKFIPLATNASITAATRQPLGRPRDDPDVRPIMIAAVKEVIDIGRGKKITLPADALERTLDFIDHSPRDEGLDGVRSRARQPPGAALARWQGRGARPRVGRANADAHPALCRAEALHHGYAGLSRALIRRQWVTQLGLLRRSAKCPGRSVEALGTLMGTQEGCHSKNRS